MSIYRKEISIIDRFGRNIEVQNLIQINGNKFNSNNEFGFSEESNYVREFSGRLTPARQNRIEAFAEALCWDDRCSHEHDCCGCMCRQRAKVSYQFNQVVIEVVQYYNY